MKKKSAAGAQSGTAVIERPETTNETARIAPLPREFRAIPVVAVGGQRTLNTRDPITRESVAELAESMSAQGLLQPIVVGEQDKDGSYQILAGRRRLLAAEVLGWTHINACVLDGGAARALEILVTENAQRSDPNPFLEAEVVARMLQQPDWSTREVAAALGQTPNWVARRAQLTKISPKVAELVAQNLESWPVRWLEELSLVDHASQLEMLRNRPPADFRELRKWVRNSMGSLGAAPWALDDATLHAKAGACTSCRKHTAAASDLFPEEPALTVLKTALCQDGACYALKRSLFLKRKVTELRKDSKKVVFVRGNSYEDRAQPKDLKAAGITAGQLLWSHEVQGAKPNDPKAVQAVVVDGPDAGQVRWVRDPKAPPEREKKRGGSKKAAGDGPVTSMADRRKALVLRRKRHVFQEFRAQLEELLKDKEKLTPAWKNADEVLLRLVAAYGTEHKGGWTYSVGKEAARGREYAAAGGAKDVRLRVMKDLVENMLGFRGCFGEHRGTGDSANSVFDDVDLFLEIVGWSGTAGMAARVKAAELALPEPKSWAAEQNPVRKLEKALTRKAGAKRAKRKAAK